MTIANEPGITLCDWTVSGMDCASCATKVRGAVSRLPGVRDVEIGIMSERLRLTVDERLTDTDKIEKTVRALGYGIQTRAAGKKDFVIPGSAPESHHGHSHADHPAVAKTDHSGHGSPGHVHDDPADRGKAWYQTSKGRLVRSGPQ